MEIMDRRTVELLIQAEVRPVELRIEDLEHRVETLEIELEHRDQS